MSTQTMTSPQLSPRLTSTELKNPELAEIEVHGLTRASFMVRGALAAGAVYGVSAVAPFVSQALAAGGGGDAEILNFALDAGVSGVRLLQRKGQVGWSQRAGEDLRDRLRRAGGRTREGADGCDQIARRHAGGEADVRLPGLATRARSWRSPRRWRTPESAPTTERRRRSRAKKCSPRQAASSRSRRVTRPRSTC